MGVSELYHVWENSTGHCRQQGMRAYLAYNDRLSYLAELYGVNIDTACGAFSALSPNNHEQANFADLSRMLQALQRGHGLDTVTTAAYPINKQKAARILLGERPLDVLRGNKTRAFYMCLADPYNKDVVVVDGHLYSAWMGKRLKMKDAQVTEWIYERISDDCKYLAGRNKVLPSQFQATCWYTWKRMWGVLYTDTSVQLGLFDLH